MEATRRAWLLATGFVFLGAALQGAEPAPPSNDDCLACHGDATLARGDGRALQPGLERFGGSIHGQAGLACVDCHAELAATSDFPHAEKLAPAACGSCHADAVAQHASGVHAGTPERAGVRCADCHGAHDILASSDRESRTYHFNVPRTCGGCHGDASVIAERKLPGGDVAALYADSIHGHALNRSGLKVAPNCASCHGAHDVRRAGDAEGKVHRSHTAVTCGTCHEGIRNRYETSVHGVAMLAGNQAAAVCSDCHTAHAIRATGVPAWKLDVIGECGSCHEESLRSYRDSFHGQATALGFTRVAACADCHGSHEIHPQHDPRSSIARPNLPQTCGKCHAGAGARFVQFDPHAEPGNRDRSPAVYYTSLFMKMLLGGVFAFFGIHTALWFPRELAARRLASRSAPRPAADDTEATGQEGEHGDQRKG